MDAFLRNPLPRTVRDLTFLSAMEQDRLAVAVESDLYLGVLGYVLQAYARPNVAANDAGTVMVRGCRSVTLAIRRALNVTVTRAMDIARALVLRLDRHFPGMYDERVWIDMDTDWDPDAQ